MTCHHYSGYEHVLRQTATHRGLVPAQLPSTMAEWRRRRGWRGQRKHLYPNWWRFMTALFVKLNMEQLHYTLLMTFLGALNIMTYHPVPARYIGGGNISSCSSLQSSTMWAWEQQVEVSQKACMWLNRTWRHWVMVLNHYFLEKWGLLEGFCYNVSKFENGSSEMD